MLAIITAIADNSFIETQLTENIMTNATYTTEQIILNLIASLCPNDKITKGNIQKVRLQYMTQPELFSQEVRIELSSVCSVAERQLERRAANRPTFSAKAKSYLNFDWNNIPGCIGFERVNVEV
ncbi:hypothetical protein NVP1081O_232 [Vibrio phage 1.081.O._10N.286.52.C2]|nr:hypothetical protein NVP1081O_232 [Vibrio phage 1.081.O._10N.286.52.C2]